MMLIGKDTVVSFTFELFDSEGKLLERGEEAASYLHGGYEGIFPKVEEALEGKGMGESIGISLEPEDAFGEYDSEMVQVESLAALPEEVEVGMRFEGTDPASGQTLIYTVTDIAEGKAVLDPNHPLAGQRVFFSCTVIGVRPASAEETAHGHVHGEGGHHH
jgi:FKBP-type peptidyl-prolyl cis-trans isomerase SlyD